jgi:hypothetical protein
MMRRLSAIVLVAVLALTGCAGESDYPPETASTLQSQVLLVSQSAQAGDPATAVRQLDELVVLVRDALAKGTITQARHDSILAAIELVRLDLEAAQAALEEQQRQLELEQQQQEEQQREDDKPGKGNDKPGKGDGDEDD